MKLNRNITERASAHIDCKYASVNLSRFLDNDLSSADATIIAAHLHGCLACRHEFEIMRAQQTMVSTLPVPPGARAARERVLRRLEAGEPAVGQPRAAGLRSSTIAYVSVASFVSLAAFAVAGAYSLVARRTPGALIVSRPPTSLSAPVRPLPLPADDEMRYLFAIHDRKMSISARALATAAIPVHKTVQRRADKKLHSSPASQTADKRFAKLAGKATGDNLALGQPNHGSMSADYLASDDVPEAL